MSQDKNKKDEWKHRLTKLPGGYLYEDGEAYFDGKKEGWFVMREDVESFISTELKRQREEIIKNLVTIRDVELSDTSMMESRAAYNINLLIDKLQKK